MISQIFTDSRQGVVCFNAVGPEYDCRYHSIPAVAVHWPPAAMITARHETSLLSFDAAGDTGDAAAFHDQLFSMGDDAQVAATARHRYAFLAEWRTPFFWVT